LALTEPFKVNVPLTFMTIAPPPAPPL